MENKLGTDANMNTNEPELREDEVQKPDAASTSDGIKDEENALDLSHPQGGAEDDGDGLSWEEFINASSPTGAQSEEDTPALDGEEVSAALCEAESSENNAEGVDVPADDAEDAAKLDPVANDALTVADNSMEVGEDRAESDDAVLPENEVVNDAEDGEAVEYENDLVSDTDDGTGEAGEPDDGEIESRSTTPTDTVYDPCTSPLPPMKEERYDPEKPRKIDLIFDFLELFVFTLVAVLIVTTFFVRHSIVEGDSMLNTLHNGDTLIISDLFYEPECGDVIVIESTELGKAIVKRVIAVSGQKVTVKPDGIYVNGEPLKEDGYVYTDGEKYNYDLSRCGKLRDNPTFRYIPGSHYEFVVPEGEVFVMGDHRSDSKDSRDLGTLPVDAILGKVLWRVLPFDSFGAVE